MGQGGVALKLWVGLNRDQDLRLERVGQVECLQGRQEQWHCPLKTRAEAAVQSALDGHDGMAGPDVIHSDLGIPPHPTPRMASQFSRLSESWMYLLAHVPALSSGAIRSTSTCLMRIKHRACHEMSPPSYLATSGFPAPVTKYYLPDTSLTIPCARRESFHIHTSNAHEALRLSRHVTSVTPVRKCHLLHLASVTCKMPAEST